MSLTFGHIVFSRLYGGLWRLARPLLRRNRRLADGFAMRLVPGDWAEPADIWLQAASGGEAYLVWELLKQLAPTGHGLRILATTWTRQGLEVLRGMAASLEKERPDLSIRVALFPLDAPEAMYRAVRMVQPKALVLLETELWPGLLLACLRRKVPVLVLNGRMTAKSLRGYKVLNTLAPGFWQAVAPRAVGAIAETDAGRFAELFGRESGVRTIPNIKFDRALSGPAQTADSAGPPSALAALLLPGQRILLASVREEEEAELGKAVEQIRSALPDVTLLVAPRHLHRVEAWQQRLSGHNPRLRSSLTAEAPAPAGSVVVWDAFGELSALYAMADAVFVGGSLAPLGGQNVLEPLAAGRIPCVGPHMDNFAWVLDTAGNDSLFTQGLLLTCRNAETLAHSLMGQLRHPTDPENVRQRFAVWLEPRLGGSAASARWLEEMIAE